MKKELTRLRSAFQRPGFVTFKANEPVPADVLLDSVFARAYGLSFDRLSVSAAGDPSQVEDLLGGEPNAVHVFSRPADEPLLHEAAEQLREAVPWPQEPQDGDVVADLIVVEPTVVYVGAHVHHRGHSPYAGALLPTEIPALAPSRAWLKLEDAIHRFHLRPKPGEVAIEIGSAPGGASFALCSRGVFVHGIDPAQMSDAVTSLLHPSGDALFTHVKKPFAHVGRKDLPKHRADYLLLDVNVAPNESLVMVEKCVQMLGERPRVALLTFKLADYEVARDLPQWLARLRQLGYSNIAAKQLGSSHKELVVCAR